MILYKVIKYKLLDIALSIFFDGIFTNTRKHGNLIPLEELYEGQYLSLIQGRDVLFRNCTITQITKIKELLDGYGETICYKITYTYGGFGYRLEGIDITDAGIDALYDYTEKQYFEYFV